MYLQVKIIIRQNIKKKEERVEIIFVKIIRVQSQVITILFIKTFVLFIEEGFVLKNLQK